MPSKNTIKNYLPEHYYHAYNRGVEKRDIFMDDQDYRVFLSLIRHLLTPKTGSYSHPITAVTGLNPVRMRQIGNISSEVQLVSYCLMPNHFHLLIWQKTPLGMKKLIQKLCTSYSMYFNKKYSRVGHLFQGIYKAVNIEGDSYLLHLSRYIHLNPTDVEIDYKTYPYSSYKYFLSEKPPVWLYPNHILEYFKQTSPIKPIAEEKFNSYKSFVEDYSEDSRNILQNYCVD